MSKKKAVLGTSPEEVLAPMAVCLQLVRGPYKVSYHAKGQKCFLVDHWRYVCSFVYLQCYGVQCAP